MQTCDSCRRTFYVTACFTNHVSKTQSGKTADHQQLSICTSCRKCSNCRKLLVGRKQQQEHRCGYVTCPSCHHYVEALSHRCFIQVAKTPEEEWAECRPKRRPDCRLRGVAAGLTTVHSNEDYVPSTSLLPSPPADGVDLNDEKPPLHVFFHMEAMQDTGRHVPNLLSGEARITTVPIPYKIVRNAQEYQLSNMAQQKKYKLVYNKRLVNPHTFQTFPYGYEWWTEEDAHVTELLTSL
ncbi:hypothetical protein pdam_00019918 [Pocillopora damicornis]|uniref:Uncharacterized protein n=1 Tax=Pocillopora damicornis TaxID=46731 RepID=A0A3M6UFG8_POCDA|nr:hypothetical protein pdam_00019918 [Pocillopora damicornis]